MEDDVLHFLYEYRKLLSRRELLGARLDPAARARLAALERLFAPEPEPGGEGRGHHRHHARCDVRIPATVKAGGRIHAVEIVNLGGGGLCVEPAPSLRQGERAVVRVVSRDTGRAYHYPVLAQWVAQRGPRRSAMGMPFVGAPLQVAARLP